MSSALWISKTGLAAQDKAMAAVAKECSKYCWTSKPASLVLGNMPIAAMLRARFLMVLKPRYTTEWPTDVICLGRL